MARKLTIAISTWLLKFRVLWVVSWFLFLLSLKILPSTNPLGRFESSSGPVASWCLSRFIRQGCTTKFIKLSGPTRNFEVVVHPYNTTGGSARLQEEFYTRASVHLCPGVIGMST